MFRKFVATTITLFLCLLLVATPSLSQDRKLLLGSGSNQSSGCTGLCEDGTATSEQINSTGPLTFTKTISANANRVLIVGVVIDDKNSVTITGVEASDDDMSFERGRDSEGGFGRAEMWRLFAPDSGEITITVSYTGSGVVFAGAVAFYGASQTPDIVFSDNNGTGTSITSGDITSNTNEILVDVIHLGVDSPAQTITPGASQTEKWNRVVTNAARGACSTKPGASTGSTSWTISSSTSWGLVIASVRPAA